MLDLFAPADEDGDVVAKARSLHAVARLLASRIAEGETVTRRSLSALMHERFGASDSSGLWSLRDAYDALEAAQVLMLADDTALAGDATDDRARVAALDAIAARLPTQSYRSERQVELQQFSTPLALAWLVRRAAAITADDVVLEPSAGTGLLAVHARRAGARLILNERDSLRAGLLGLIFETQVFAHDAEHIDDLLPPALRPSVVLINPPFARSEARGRDAQAGARHLRSALARLTPGGRCVAIMSPAFAPDGSGARGYAAVRELVPPRFELTILGQPFRKHGTSIAVRLLVFDKGWSGNTERHVVTDFAAAWEQLAALPGRHPVGGEAGPEPAVVRTIMPVVRPIARGGLLGGAGGRRLAAPTAPSHADREPVPLDYMVLTEPLPAGEPIGIYVPWRLSRIVIPGARPHPDELVESMAMASILPPAPRHVPLLTPRAIAALSDAQLETIIQAGDAFARDLPQPYKPNDSGTLLLPAADGSAYRLGYFLGDGTGVGKGQQVAGCILDRWCRGSRKAVWVSKSAALVEDARRDWRALGGASADVQPLDAIPVGEPIAMSAGILFVTYATLRSQRHDSASRLQQILAWLGEDFDGLIAFDEAHEMANAAGTETSFGTQKGSEQGLAGVRLQNLCPRACILYVSATGATDPANLCYAIRLGLWGPGTAFADRDAFMTAIASGGIAAMEIVARDLKALGLYTARALTFRGVEYAPLEHELTAEQIAIYDAYADGWAIIHRNLDTVLEATGIVDRMTGTTLNGQAKGAALSRFESAKQRFFAQLLVGMKMPTLIAAIEGEVADGRSAIVQLVTTAEAMLDRALAGLSADEAAALEIELSPREYMIDYLRTAFPTRMMRLFKGTDGEMHSEPMLDGEGRPVHCQEALRARDELVEQLCSLPAVGAALDELIRHFGTDALAEVTGRSRRIIIDGQGRQKIDRRPARASIAEADAFMAGSKPILAFSDAGGTGRSYHADRTCPSAGRRRVHFLLEPGWRASAAIQGLGRSHRTNQASAPVFRPVTTDCRGERRFISTIARRLDALGALTRGQRQTGGQNLFHPADNLESDYARDALGQWYQLLHRGKLASTTLEAFVAMTGLRLVDSCSGGLLDDLPPIQRWLNRLLALRIATQNAIFEEYLGLIEARVEAARAAGRLDVGVETIMAERIVTVEEHVLRRDPLSGAETRLARLELHRRPQPLVYDELVADHGERGGAAWLRNGRSGRVALRVRSPSFLDDDGDEISMWRLLRPNGQERIRANVLAESHWDPIDATAFRTLWDAEVAELRERIDIETISLATGLLLPVWDRLPDDDVRVWRLCDAQGASMLGRIISPAGVDRLGQAFGLDARIALSPAELVAGARSGNGVALPMLGHARLIRAFVNDSARLEIRDFPPARRDWLKAQGCFGEVIAFKTRLFVPVDRAEAILSAIIAGLG
jgi:hypothetical protein